VICVQNIGARARNSRLFRAESFQSLQKRSDPNGIRTRVTAVKGQCPNRWTIGSINRKKIIL